MLSRASQHQDSLVVLDDREGRRCADELEIRRVGTLGIVVLAKKEGGTLSEHIEPMLQRDLRHRNAVAHEGSFTSELVGWVEVV